MLPESKILQNKFHNANVVKLIMEQPSLDVEPNISPDKIKSLVDQAQIPGLTGNYPKWIPNKLRSYYEKKGKKLPVGTTTYTSWESYLADLIYKSKGTVKDNENNATIALMQIKSAEQFNKVLKELQKLTGGKGIGQFILSFFGTYNIDASGKISIEWHSMDHYKTAKRLNSIVEHLKSINANPKSIDILEKALQNVRSIAKREKGKYESDEWAAVRFAEKYKHEIALVLSIAAMFLPAGAMLVSSGIMLADAAMYYNEGRYYESGVMVIFALLPYIGGAISKSAAVKELGAKGMAKLGQKLATSKSPILNRLEQIVIKDMSKYAPQIKQDMNAYFQRRFQNEMINILKTTSGPKARRLLYRLGTGTLKASVFGTKLGVSFIPYELSLAGWDKIYSKFDIQDRETIAREALEIQRILGKR